MPLNLPHGFTETETTDINLHEEAGLLFDGMDEDGDFEYIGSEKQWKKYYSLLEQHEQN